jgi:hypothetical protein
MGMLADLPDQGFPVAVRHPVFGFYFYFIVNFLLKTLSQVHNGHNRSVWATKIRFCIKKLTSVSLSSTYFFAY